MRKLINVEVVERMMPDGTIKKIPVFGRLLQGPECLSRGHTTKPIATDGIVRSCGNRPSSARYFRPE